MTNYYYYYYYYYGVTLQNLSIDYSASFLSTECAKEHHIRTQMDMFDVWYKTVLGLTR